MDMVDMLLDMVLMAGPDDTMELRSNFEETVREFFEDWFAPEVQPGFEFIEEWMEDMRPQPLSPICR